MFRKQTVFWDGDHQGTIADYVILSLLLFTQQSLMHGPVTCDILQAQKDNRIQSQGAVVRILAALLPACADALEAERVGASFKIVLIKTIRG